MMTFRARIIAFLLGLIVLAAVSFLIRRRRLYNVYAITWFFVSLAFFAMAIYPPWLEAMSAFVGIYSTPVAILVVAIACLMGIVLHLSIIVTEQHKMIRWLEKEVAIINKESEAGNSRSSTTG